MSVPKRDDPTYELLTLLDRLEDLRDEMLDLEVTDIAEIDARIHDLESQLHDVPDSDADGPV